MEKGMSYGLSRFLKMTFENFLGILRLSVPKFTFLLRHRCSLKLLLNRVPSFHLHLECALEPLT